MDLNTRNVIWRLVRRGRWTTGPSEIVLADPTLIIGRNVVPQYRIEHANVSRMHAALKFENLSWHITDLKSRNGSFVNNNKLKPSNYQELKEGDTIAFGNPKLEDNDVFVFVLEKRCIKQEIEVINDDEADSSVSSTQEPRLVEQRQQPGPVSNVNHEDTSDGCRQADTTDDDIMVVCVVKPFQNKGRDLASNVNPVGIKREPRDSTEKTLSTCNVVTKEGPLSNCVSVTNIQEQVSAFGAQIKCEPGIELSSSDRNQTTSVRELVMPNLISVSNQNNTHDNCDTNFPASETTANKMPNLVPAFNQSTTTTTCSFTEFSCGESRVKQEPSDLQINISRLDMGQSSLPVSENERPQNMSPTENTSILHAKENISSCNKINDNNAPGNSYHNEAALAEPASRVLIKQESTAHIKQEPEAFSFSQEDEIITISDDEPEVQVSTGYFQLNSDHGDSNFPEHTCISPRNSPQDEFLENVLENHEDQNSFHLPMMHLGPSSSSKSDRNANSGASNVLYSNAQLGKFSINVSSHSGFNLKEQEKNLQEPDRALREFHNEDAVDEISEMTSEFFPVLSQGFESDDDSERQTAAGSFYKKDTLCKQRLDRINIASGVENLQHRKGGKKKTSLKDTIRKKAQHRLPFPGGGSAIPNSKFKSSDKIFDTASSSTVQSQRSTVYKKDRFKSRQMQLLDVEESLNAATSCKNKPVRRKSKGETVYVTKSAVQKTSKLASMTGGINLRGGLEADHMQESSSTMEFANGDLPSKSINDSSSVSRKKLLEELHERKSAHSSVNNFKIPRKKQVSRNSVGSDLQDKTTTVSCTEVIKRRRSSEEWECGKPPKQPRLESTESSKKPKSILKLVPEERITDQKKKVSFAENRQELCNLKVPDIDPEKLISSIVNWKYKWLSEKEKTSDNPPILGSEDLVSAKATYSSFEEYVRTFYKFLVVETWESLYHGWRDHYSKLLPKYTYYVTLVDVSVAYKADLTTVSCSMLVSPQQEKASAHPVEGNLLCLFLPLQNPPNAFMSVLGYVYSNRFVRAFNDQENRNGRLLEVKVYIASRYIQLDKSKKMKICVVGQLMTVLRQLEALVCLGNSGFAECVIKPSPTNFWRFCSENQYLEYEESYNSSQKRAIQSVVNLLKQPSHDNKIVLLHGPPGTGKTHTILGVVRKIFDNPGDRHVLIVAPSNAAVDEIGRRLLQLRQQQSGSKKLKIVRLGKETMIDPMVSKIYIENLVTNNIEHDVRNLKEEFQKAKQEFQVKLSSLKDDLDDAYIKKNKKIVNRIKFEISVKERELNNVTCQEREKLNQIKKDRKNRKACILQRAHIILSTLNSCHSRQLEEILVKRRLVKFTCCIVDEATQCTESEMLQCFRYNFLNLVLIGDPLQLQATVLSLNAADRGFQTSMFERFYNILNETDSSAIHMLTEQGRMHPMICEFASQHFYKGQLKTLPCITEKYYSFPLNPLVVFDINYTSETMNGSTSLYNTGEAEFVCRLCNVITSVLEKDCNTIGIITPYQAQKKFISQRLEEVGNLSINTVDGFQGQERDIIIVSCVRASNPPSSIGFVADRRRMNVAITRARKTLIVCCNMNSLKDSACWLAFYNYALAEGCVHRVSAVVSGMHIKKIIMK